MEEFGGSEGVNVLRSGGISQLDYLQKKVNQ